MRATVFALRRPRPLARASISAEQQSTDQDLDETLRAPIGAVNETYTKEYLHDLSTP
jgi:hypothetical protein